MALFTWSPEYSVGNDLIDGEHKTLYEMADRLHSAMLSRQGHAVLQSLFAQLAGYTRTHFSHEEALMAKHAYPQLAEHAEIHRQLIAKLAKLQDDLKGGKLTVTTDTLQFLKEWLRHHIGKTDRLLASYVREGHPGL
ncbi:MAG: bacteriohemerythrin [Bryobacteraceae bacterium]|jgi:hemerythrin-like metal-binding protein